MKNAFFAVMCLLAVLVANAQEKDGKREFSREEYKQQLEAFVVKEACLTPEEGKALFPMVYDMMKALKTLGAQERELMRKADSATSEKEYENLLLKATDLSIECKKTEQKFYKKFHSVVSWKKVVLVRKALFKFNMQALKQFNPRSSHPRRHHQGQNQNHQRK